MSLAPSAKWSLPAKFSATPGLLYSLVFASGIAGLGYQILWTRLLSMSLGHDYMAVLGVITAFFAGLAIGGLAFDRVISTSARPHLWFAGLEAVIGLWALVAVWLFPFVGDALPSLLGPNPSPALLGIVTFVVPFLLLAPAVIAMGATLPAADRVAGRLNASSDRQEAPHKSVLGGLYGANTLGAVIGVYGLMYWLLPSLGFSKSLLVFAVLNLTCAVLLMTRFAGQSQPEAKQTRRSAAKPTRKVLALIFLTGFLGIAFEVVMIRALAQSLENTVFSYASVLAIYLLGTAFGAALYHRIPVLRRASYSAVLAALSGACALSVFLLPLLPTILSLADKVPAQVTLAAAVSEGLAGALVFFVPTAVMGVLFCRIAEPMRGPEGGIGLALFFNTLGGALAPVLVGLGGLLLLGVVPALFAIALSYGVLALIFSFKHQRARLLTPLAIGSALVSSLGFAPQLRPSLLSLPPETTALASIDGVLGTVNVYGYEGGPSFLKINNGYVMGGTTTVKGDRRQGHIPLLLHGNPKSALFLGLGTGATFAAASPYPGLKAQAAELVPEVIDVLPYFESVSGAIAADADLTLRVGDARRVVKAGQDKLDVVVSDTFHPSRDGAGLLYTVEHFEAIKARLKEDGLFCQWLPLHQLDAAALKSIVQSFLHVFPDAIATLNDLSLETPVLGLIGGYKRAKPDARILASNDVQAELTVAGLRNGFGPLSGVISGPDALKAYAGGAPLNRDDHPHVMFASARTAYSDIGAPEDRLIALLSELGSARAETFVNAKLVDRLQRYWAARDAFLLLGAKRPENEDRDGVVRQMAPKLLSIVRLSPDFAPAYDPLLNMAGYLRQNNPPAAYALLYDLSAAAPNRRDAQVLLGRWYNAKLAPQD